MKVAKGACQPGFCLLGSLLTVILLSGFFHDEVEAPEGYLGKIPVQSGGRVKPFESFAREALLSVAGKTSFEGQSAVPVVWEWIIQPEDWYTKSFLPVRYGPLREEFALMVIQGKISPELVLTHPPFQEKVTAALKKQEAKGPLSILEKKRIELFDRARLFQAIAQGALPGFFPDPEDPREGWMSLATLADPESRSLLELGYTPSGVAEVHSALGELVQAYRGEGRTSRLDAARNLHVSLDRLRESRDIAFDQSKLQAELFYNRLRPFLWAWILYLASGIFWFFLRDRIPAVGLGFFGAGFVFHTLGFILRCYVAGRPPVSNMYESIIWVAWAAILFSIILGFVHHRSIFPAVAAWVGAFGLIVGESFPAVLDPSFSPLVPVLRSNYWLTVHVLTITLSYGAFALAWGLAHANLAGLAFYPERGQENDEMGNYVYRALQIGVVLLAAGTILGGVWANDSWGRFWGWDPKETWALIALFGYLAVLHGRFAGWLGTFGTALGSIVAFLGILMAWYGVNFVLAAGFHSYGFGGGGLPFVLGVVTLDLILVSYFAFRYHKNKKRIVAAL